jgi:plastocyanin
MSCTTIFAKPSLRAMYALIFAAISCLITPAWSASVIVSAIDRDLEKMGNVVIYATPVGVSLPPATSLPGVTISQEDLQFSPYVTAIRTGTAIKFPNYDKIEHHVKSFSPAKEFEIQVYDKELPPPVVFDKPGIVVIYCLFHGWMRAYVNVLDTPYFATTDTVNGVAKLNGLPEGTYEIRAWHPDMGTVKVPLLQTVKIAATNAPLRFDFDFVAKKRRAKK